MKRKIMHTEVKHNNLIEAFRYVNQSMFAKSQIAVIMTVHKKKRVNSVRSIDIHKYAVTTGRWLS